MRQFMSEKKNSILQVSFAVGEASWIFTCAILCVLCFGCKQEGHTKSPDPGTSHASGLGADLPARGPGFHMIYVVGSDGSNPRMLTTDGDNRNPVWSPDGSRLAFARRPDHGDPWEIHIVSTSGGNSKSLIMASNELWPTVSWAPDGSSVVASSLRGDRNDVTTLRNDIYTVNVSSGRTTKLTSERYDNFRPSWSPDGKKILFTSLDGRSGIYVMDKTGENQRQLFRNEAGGSILFDSGDQPQWAPDCLKIAFAADSGIYVIEIGNSRLARVVDHGKNPSWSPDGTRMAFTARHDVFIINADGSNLHQLTRVGDVHEDAGSPVWSPNGKKIAFVRMGYSVTHDGHTSHLFVVNNNGTGLTRLTKGPHRVECPSWSPDGSSIAFAAGDPPVYRLDPPDPK